MPTTTHKQKSPLFTVRSLPLIVPTAPCNHLMPFRERVCLRRGFSAFTFGSEVTWQVKPHSPRWWCSDRGESTTNHTKSIVWPANKSSLLHMLPELLDKRHLCEFVCARIDTVCTCMDGCYQGIFSVFMPETISTYISVTVSAPYVECVGVSFFLCVCVWLFLFLCTCLRVCVRALSG